MFGMTASIGGYSFANYVTPSAYGSYASPFRMSIGASGYSFAGAGCYMSAGAHGVSFGMLAQPGYYNPFAGYPMYWRPLVVQGGYPHPWPSQPPTAPAADKPRETQLAPADTQTEKLTLAEPALPEKKKGKGGTGKVVI